MIILLAFLLLLFSQIPTDAGTVSVSPYAAVLWHATDCRANNTNARFEQECGNLSDGARYVCKTPAAGGDTTTCDTNGEWQQEVGGSGGSQTLQQTYDLSTPSYNVNLSVDGVTWTGSVDPSSSFSICGATCTNRLEWYYSSGWKTRVDGVVSSYPPTGGGSGDITDVGNCPSGSCFQSVTQNFVLAAPVGATGQMAPRALADADIPNTITASNYLPLTGGTMTGSLIVPDVTTSSSLAGFLTLQEALAGGSNFIRLQAPDARATDVTLLLPTADPTSGQYLSCGAPSSGISTCIWATPSGAGTVTSVGVTVPAEWSVSGSPVTTSGTIAITKATQSANTVYKGPNSGGAAVPTFAALVNADIPVHSVTKLDTTGASTGYVPTYNGSVVAWAAQSGGGGGGTGVGRKTIILTYAAIADGTCQEQSATWTGISTNDIIALGNPAALAAGLISSLRVSATDTIAIRLCNLSGASVTPGATTYNLVLTNYTLTGNGTIDFGAIADGACLASTFPLTGVTAGDALVPRWSSAMETGLFGTMIASAPDTVQVRVCNLSGASVNPSSHSFGVAVAK